MPHPFYHLRTLDNNPLPGLDYTMVRQQNPLSLLEVRTIHTQYCARWPEKLAGCPGAHLKAAAKAGHAILCKAGPAWPLRNTGLMNC